MCRNVILRHQPKNLYFLTDWFYEILHGVYPELNYEILCFAQNDKRRVQNDKHGISLIMTQSPRGEGMPPAELKGGIFWHIFIILAP